MPSCALGCETAQAHVGSGPRNYFHRKAKCISQMQDKLKFNQGSLCFITLGSSSKFLCSLSSFCGASIHVCPSITEITGRFFRGRSDS